MELLELKNQTYQSSIRISEITGKRHSHVIRDLKNLLKELYGIYYFKPTSKDGLTPDYQIVTNNNGTKVEEILINEKLSLCLASGYSIALRMLIIEDWSRLKKIENKPLSLLQILEKAVESEKEKILLQQQNEALLPKANYAEEVISSDGCLLSTQIAKELGFKSATQFHEYLSDINVLYRVNDSWELYSKYSGNDYTKHGTKLIKHNNGESFTKTYLKWTEKGRYFIHEMIKANKYDPTKPKLVKNVKNYVSTLS